MKKTMMTQRWPRCARSCVLLGILVAGGMQNSGAYECLIESNRMVEIRSPVEGLIAEVKVERGDEIARGQVLVTLDSTVERTAVAVARYRAEMSGPVEAARSRLEFARKKVERFSSLEGKSFVSAQQKDEADAEARLAEAELINATEARELARIEHKRAVALLEQRVLHSPFAGFVTDRILNPGDLADPSANASAILRVAELNPLKVVVTLPLSLAGRIKTGMRARVTTEDAKFTVEATVASVDAELDAKSGTFRSHLKLPNAGYLIPAGLRCEAEFVDLPAAGVVEAPGVLSPEP